MNEPIEKLNQATNEEIKKDSLSIFSPASPDEIAGLKKEITDLREKLLQCRETDIFSLKEKVASLASQLKLSLAIVGVAAAILGGFGIKQYGDLNELINKSMTQRIDESLGYYDQVTRATFLVNSGGCSSAIPIFNDLLDKRPDDEVVFMNVMHCFDIREEYDQGYRLLSKLKEKGVFPKKFQQLFSYNNTGFLVWVKSLTDPSFEKEAQELLRRAEQIGITEESKDIVFPLYNLTLFHIAKGEIDKATVYSDRMKSIDIEGPDWTDAVESRWFKQLKIKQPNASKLLQQLLPSKKKTSSTVNQPSNK